MTISTKSPTRRERAPAAGWTVAVVLLGFFALPMSMSGAGVAVPRIAAELQSTGPAAQWVVTAYFLTASSFMLVAGSLGDAIGRRRIYRWGAVAFTVGCLAAALSPTIAVLLAARVLTGLGAAGVMAGGGALLGSRFAGPQRTRVFAALGTIAGLGLALGPTLSGASVALLGWRLGFGVFILPGLLLVAGTWLIAESRPARRAPIDVAGAVLFIAGLAILMLAVTRGSAGGWTPVETLVLPGIAAVLAAAFVVVERRALSPVLELSLLRHRRFLGWLVAGAAMSTGFVGVLAFLPSYLQDPVGMTATTTGLVMLLPTVPMMLFPFVGAHLVNRGVPPALLISAALLAMAGGNAGLAVLHPDATALGLAPPLVVLGAGAGLAAGIIDSQAMNQVGDERVGMAAGMLNTARGTANALTLAVFGAALIGLLAAKSGSAHLAGLMVTGNIPEAAAGLAGDLTDAWRVVLFALALFCTAAAAVAGILVGGQRKVHES